MAKKKSKPSTNPLDQLLRAAKPTVLRQLVQRLIAGRPELRRECLEFLQKHVGLTAEANADVEAEAAFAIWDELAPDLAELNRRGGGPEEIETRVGNLLNKLSGKLKAFTIPKEARQGILDEVMPYIRSRNSGMEDPLYAVAYAVCKDDEDWRDLAERLESLGQDWPPNQAQDIYRRLGDRK